MKGIPKHYASIPGIYSFIKSLRQAYSYFIPLGSTNEPPQLLIDTLLCAEKYFDKITFVSRSDLIPKFKQIFPDIVCIDVESLCKPSFSSNYIGLVESKVISSNHPPTELLCLERWHYMNECFKEGSLDSRYPCAVLDWDTFLLDPVSVAIDQHLLSVDPLKSITGFIELGIDVCLDHQSFPLYDICPSLIILAHEHVILFCDFLSRMLNGTLDVSRIYKGRFFNDMSIWSCVISHCVVFRNHSIFDLDRYPYTHGIFFDHNIRIPDQKNTVDFEMQEFPVDKRFRCTSSPTLEIKKMFFADGGIVVRSKTNEYRLGCIHFSGVEAKYIYHCYFRDKLTRRSTKPIVRP